VDDYNLDALYAQSAPNFYTYLEGFLIQAIDDFDICTQALVYDEETQEFSVTLTNKNKLILANIMVKCWLEKEVNNILQMRNHIQDHDFKTFSAAANLKEKKDLLRGKEEEIDLQLSRYEYDANDWDGWEIQDFAG
jgi:hypothetical protein